MIKSDLFRYPIEKVNSKSGVKFGNDKKKIIKKY